MSDAKNNPKSYQEYVKSGQYFSDARSWYDAIYLTPFIHRTWLLVLTLIAVGLFLIAMFNVIHILPLEEKIPYVLQVEDAITQSAMIEPLAQKDEEAWVSVATYLVKDYILLREEYAFSEYRDKKLEQRKQRVRKSSSKTAYQEYISQLNDSNPRSPVRLYRNVQVRAINFENIEFMRLDQTSGKADVTFTADVITTKTGETTSTSWKAELYFQLPVIDPEAQKGVTLNFLVTSYKVTPISS